MRKLRLPEWILIYGFDDTQTRDLSLEWSSDGLTVSRRPWKPRVTDVINARGKDCDLGLKWWHDVKGTCVSGVSEIF